MAVMLNPTGGKEGDFDGGDDYLNMSVRAL